MIGFCQTRVGHVKVPVFQDKPSPSIQAALDSCAALRKKLNVPAQF
jgi:hypothetical protein